MHFFSLPIIFMLRFILIVILMKNHINNSFISARTRACGTSPGQNMAYRETNSKTSISIYIYGPYQVGFRLCASLFYKNYLLFSCFLYFYCFLHIIHDMYKNDILERKKDYLVYGVDVPPACQCFLSNIILLLNLMSFIPQVNIFWSYY